MTKPLNDSLSIPKLLVVDDDRKLAGLIRDYLTHGLHGGIAS